MSESYRILDEPTPSRISHLAVRPLWPLLAVMFGGAWAAWPWFALNGYAMGSPTRKKELLWVIGGFVGSAVIYTSLLNLFTRDVLDLTAIRYLLVGLIVWKLLVSYSLYMLQARTFAIYEHFGGIARNGLLAVIVFGFMRPRVIEPLPEILRMMLA